MIVEIKPGICTGNVTLPASKSLSHRALICAGLADGTSHIKNISTSRDIQATISCLEALGAKIISTPDSLEVTGTKPENLTRPVTLDAYESGSTLRFFIPIAASGNEEVTFLGQPTLLSRPMGIYADLFLSQNLPFAQSGESIKFHGKLSSGLYQIPGNISSQFISGLLFSLPLQNGGVIAVLPPYESRSYVDLTVEMMEKFGVDIHQPTSEAYEIEPGQEYKPANICVEGDYSQLAFFGVLAALQSSGQITCKNISRNSRQGDRIILDLLQQAGAGISWNEEGNIVTISPAGDNLRSLEIDLADCPDLGPILCVLAACTPGKTVIYNASRLRYKECDRIAAMEAELKKFSVDISSTENEIVIIGKKKYENPDNVYNPLRIDSHNDHRIVMAMSIFALAGGISAQIENAQAITKSYPAFFEDLKKLGGNIIEKESE